MEHEQLLDDVLLGPDVPFVRLRHTPLVTGCVGLIRGLLQAASADLEPRDERLIAQPLGALLYLAWQTLADKSPIDANVTAAAVPFWSTIRTAVLISLLNSKLTIFFIAFLPQLVPSNEEAAWLHMVGLNAVFMAVTFVVFALHGVFAAGM